MTRATKIHMTPEQDEQFYATILAGVIANTDIGGAHIDKVDAAIRIGDLLKRRLSDRPKTTTPTVLKG